MARNVLVWTLTGIGVFIGEVSQYSSYTEDITATEPISKVSQTYRFEKKFAVMAVFLISLKIREIAKNVHVTVINFLLRSCVLLPL